MISVSKQQREESLRVGTQASLMFFFISSRIASRNLKRINNLIVIHWNVFPPSSTLLNAIRMRLIFIDLEPILCHDDNYREHVKMSSTATFSLLPLSLIPRIPSISIIDEWKTFLSYLILNLWNDVTILLFNYRARCVKQ